MLIRSCLGSLPHLKSALYAICSTGSSTGSVSCSQTIVRWDHDRRRISSSTVSAAPTPSSLRDLSILTTEAHNTVAREWVNGFKEGDIPKEALEAGFARSSGPGGQHVNKTNSKAMIRCSLGDWLPPFVLPPLRSSPHYLPNPPSLLITSQLSRSAPQNQAAAMSILHQTIISAARSVIKGTTSSEQKQKVQGLMRREEGRRRMDKDRLKSKKAARRE
ncbi:RF-1 domain-containing protein [Dioszegia hungarica]|uniref:RF-1 domain-containing protein n=1 Tax=Dioszegia hungarica TaxID=4972 RepID=A0AA38HEF3_9TREE|nr:RF-1 domain-containing protein [Dioszegia hungarica]KAI9637759.1 RF-1 domain-containing protein [Dioszegia hungarica]